MLAQNDPVD